MIGTRVNTVGSMRIELPDIRPEDRTPLIEALLGIMRQLIDRVAQLEEANQHLRDEIATLKGQKPRPDIKPNLLETAKPKTQGEPGAKRPGSAKRPKTAELHIQVASGMFTVTRRISASSGQPLVNAGGNRDNLPIDFQLTWVVSPRAREGMTLQNG